MVPMNPSIQMPNMMMTPRPTMPVEGKAPHPATPIQTSHPATIMQPAQTAPVSHPIQKAAQPIAMPSGPTVPVVNTAPAAPTPAAPVRHPVLNLNPRSRGSSRRGSIAERPKGLTDEKIREMVVQPVAGES